MQTDIQKSDPHQRRLEGWNLTWGDAGENCVPSVELYLFQIQ
jgi:hypothetical protein